MLKSCFFLGVCFLYSSNVFLFFLVIDYKQCFLKVDMDVRILGANSLDYQIDVVSLVCLSGLFVYIR